ncbi:MAG: hypothetical protein PHE27_03870 [Alphaproteobacteria bacterium]|nr:hypothetical protein [Alphaproteobacteria bacterium]
MDKSIQHVTTALRQIGKNIALPFYYRKIDPGTVSKKSGDPACGDSPVTYADIATQILFTRERKKDVPDDPVFGEEYIPPFTTEEQAVIDALDITRPFDLSNEDARNFFKILKTIIESGKTLPKSATDDYRPLGHAETCIDPIDGTINFSKGLPKFSIQLSSLTNGCIEAAWIYRPIQDEMFRRIGNGPSEHVTFTSTEDGNVLERIEPITLQPSKPFSEMTVVYSHAHPNVLLDELTEAIYAPDGERLSLDAIVKRFGNTFKAVEGTDGYSYDHGRLFLGEVAAVCGPGTYSWDQFAQAFIAQKAGYRVGFIDGEDFLGKSGEIPFIHAPNGSAHVKQTGGVLYAHPENWEALNWELNGKHVAGFHEVARRKLPILRANASFLQTVVRP